MNKNSEAMKDEELDKLHNRRLAGTKGRRRARALTGDTADAPVTTGSFDHRAPAAFAARESDLYGHMLLEKMIQQTLDPYMHIPAVQIAAELGVKPLLRTPEGDRIREELNARLLYPSEGTGRRFFGVRFEIDGYPFQYGLTSGAQSSIQGDNDWVESITELVEEYRPAKLIAGPASRLARIVPLFVQMEAPLKAARTVVVTVEAPDGIDLRTNAGLELWHALARGAESDYKQTVLRLLTGVLYELKNNRYPRSALSLYPGYRKRGGRAGDKHTIALKTDPETVAFVRRFIELAASDASDDEIVAELTPLGLRARHPKLVQEGCDSPADVSDPRRMIRSLYPALLTYLDGTYRFQHEMPLPYYDEIHGFPVHRNNPHDYGFIRHDLDFGVPEGGWHDPELIKEAITRRMPDRDSPPPVTRDTVKPLAGLLRWTEDGQEYCLLSNERESYQLRRRPISGETAKRTRRSFAKKDGELVGRFDARVLHAAVAQVLRQLGEGSPAALPCPVAPPASQELIADLQQQREEAQRQADAARREIVRARDDEEAQPYRKLAEEFQSEIRRLSAELAREQAKMRPTPGFTLDGNRLAALIRILEDLPGPTDNAVARSLRSLVSSARILDAGPTQPLARLEMTLSIRTNAGALTVGPISVPVKNRAVGGKPGTDARREGFTRRNQNLVEELLLEGSTEQERRELWETEDFTARSYTRRMFEALAPVVGGRVASALIHCPIVDVRRAALEPYLHHGIPLSDGFPPALADEIRHVYVPTDFSWSNGWCPGGMARERQVLAFIDRYAKDPDTGLPTVDVQRIVSIDFSALYRMMHEGDAPYGRKTPSPAPWYARLEYLSGPRGPRSPGSRVRIRQCPHCGERKLIQPLRVPEVAGYLLCVNCRRSLLSPIQYPDEFFLPWDGPQTLPRRRPDTGASGENQWFSTSGRIVVGTTLCTVHVPSLYAPRGRS